MDDKPVTDYMRDVYKFLSEREPLQIDEKLPICKSQVVAIDTYATCFPLHFRKTPLKSSFFGLCPLS